MKPRLNPISCIPWFNLWFFSIRVHSWFHPPGLRFIFFRVFRGFEWFIRVHSWFYYSPFRVFRVFRGSICSSSQFVSIRVHSWFRLSPCTLFRAFRVFRGFEWFIRVHSCPFVVHSPSPPSSLLPTYQKPTAKCPRTTFSSLLPSPYFASIHPVRILGKSGHSKPLEYKELDIALIAQRL